MGKISRKWMKEGVSGLEGGFGEKVKKGESHCWWVSEIIRGHQHDTAISVAQCWFCHRDPNFCFSFLLLKQLTTIASLSYARQRPPQTVWLLHTLWYFGSYQLHFQKTFLSTAWAWREWLRAVHFSLLPPLLPPFQRALDWGSGLGRRCRIRQAKGLRHRNSRFWKCLSMLGRLSTCPICNHSRGGTSRMPTALKSNWKLKRWGQLPLPKLFSGRMSHVVKGKHGWAVKA